MPQINTQELLDFIRVSIAKAVKNDPESIKAIFARNGVELPSTLKEDEIYASVLAGMRVSPTFRSDITSYLKSSPYASYVEDGFQSADGTTPSGSTVRQSLTPERVGSYLDAAANLLVSALGSKMRKEGEERAINFELAQKDRLTAEAQTKAPLAEGQKKILVPVLIGVSVLFVAGLVYYVVKRGKK
jgi:hypothetical protein